VRGNGGAAGGREGKMRAKLPVIDHVILDADLVTAAYHTGELKPCPFCGSDRALTFGERKGIGIQYRVSCIENDCMADVFSNAQTAEEARAGAVKKWNRRTAKESL